MSELLVTTTLGDFSIKLDAAAPATSAYFSSLAKSKALDNSAFYRIVAPDNATHRAEVPIAVVQGGLLVEDPQPIAPIAHESTAATGLRHDRWVVSCARYAPGETYGSFFVCLRDEPELDYGGKRHPDGLGFAAFGKVGIGREIVEAIYARREQEEMLAQPIAIRSVIAS